MRSLGRTEHLADPSPSSTAHKASAEAAIARLDRRTRDSHRLAGFQTRVASVLFDHDSGQGSPGRRCRSVVPGWWQPPPVPRWVGEEGAEKSHRAELYGEAETHVVPPAATDHRQVGISEMEIAIK